jgi:hypothetical protein
MLPLRQAAGNDFPTCTMGRSPATGCGRHPRSLSADLSRMGAPSRLDFDSGEWGSPPAGGQAGQEQQRSEADSEGGGRGQGRALAGSHAEILPSASARDIRRMNTPGAGASVAAPALLLAGRPRMLSNGGPRKAPPEGQAKRWNGKGTR